MAVTRSGLVFEETFNTVGTTAAGLDSGRFDVEGSRTMGVAAVAGRTAVKFQLDHYGSPDPMRTELVPDGIGGASFTDTGYASNAKLGQPVWYGMSTFIPADREDDGSDEIIMQWAGMPDFSKGETWRNPAVALQIVSRPDGDHFWLVIRADSHEVTPGTLSTSPSTRYDHVKSFDLGLVDAAKGKWTDWVWKFNFDYDGDGRTTLWRDGVKVLDEAGGNAFNDAVGPYFKFGVYKWPWDSSQDTGADSRTVYFDDLRIAGGGEATYDSVAPAPSGTSAPTPTPSPPPTPSPAPTPAPTPGDGGAPAGAVYKSSTYALASGEANLVLTGAADAKGVGNALDNVIVGNNGRNEVWGGDGKDTLRGGGGNDDLHGGAHGDRLEGGAGNDLLYGGGSGADTMAGGAGADRFVFKAAYESRSAERDAILDFNRAEGDRLDVSAIDANAKASGDQAFAFIGGSAFSGTAGQLRAASGAGGALLVEADIDGNRTADFQVAVTGAASLSGGDFVL